jgi:hypothetical protein
MKRWMLCMLCMITLGLGFAGLASAGQVGPSSADQQFLASLANPAPTQMTKPQPPPNPCGPDFCTSAQQSACYFNCLNTVGCEGYLFCSTSTCTSTCSCIGRCF